MQQRVLRLPVTLRACGRCHLGALRRGSAVQREPSKIIQELLSIPQPLKRWTPAPTCCRTCRTKAVVSWTHFSAEAPFPTDRPGHPRPTRNLTHRLLQSAALPCRLLRLAEERPASPDPRGNPVGAANGTGNARFATRFLAPGRIGRLHGIGLPTQCATASDPGKHVPRDRRQSLVGARLWVARRRTRTLYCRGSRA